MLRVGLTGGIGSGKTTVANLFKNFDVTIIDADEIAAAITKPNTYSYDSIVKHFGENILNNDKTLDRKKLRSLIFNNTEERKWLENLLHPVIREVMRERIAQVKTAYCLLVIPLLAESNHIDFIDRVCVIDVPESIRIKRVSQRDGTTESDVEAIIASQCADEKRLSIADDIITNDGDIEALRSQVYLLHEKYLTLAKDK